jgi:hypothetical protein
LKATILLSSSSKTSLTPKRLGVPYVEFRVLRPAKYCDSNLQVDFLKLFW